MGGVEGLVAVGHYEADNDWWVCKHLKKGIEGPVLSIAWHQSGILLAAGTLAGQVNLLSAFVEGVDDKAALRSITWAEPQASAAFNSEIMSIQVGSWIHAVSFSKSGEALAWANQDAVITVFYPGSNVQWSLCPTSKNGLPLPFKKLIFLSENVLMAAGHGAVPMILSGSERQEWKVRMVLESEQISSKRTASGTQGRKKSIFEEAALQGRSTAEMSRNLEAEDAPAHMSTITGLDAFEGNRQVSKVVSTGLDGRLVIWSIGKLAAQYELELASV